MKLILKRIRPASPEEGKQGGPFCLYTEDGQALPNQIISNMESGPSSPVRLTVVFIVDGNHIKVEGDA